MGAGKAIDMVLFVQRTNALALNRLVAMSAARTELELVVYTQASRSGMLGFDGWMGKNMDITW